MSLAALALAQALVSLTPTMENTRLLRELAPEAPPAVELTGAAPFGEVPAPWALLPDTVRRRAVTLSDGYYTRLDIHRIASYGTLPLFLLEYLAGQKLLEEGSGAPLWAEKVHKPAAYLVAGLAIVAAWLAPPRAPQPLR